MMDGTSGGPERPTLVERASGRKNEPSLVEKAAEKLNFLVGAEARPVPEPARPEPVPPEAFRSEAPGNQTEPPARQPAGPSTDGQRSPAAPAGGSPSAAGPGPLPKAAASVAGDDRAPVPAARSRQVAVDFSRLASRGVMTPDTLRTKTTEEFRLLKRTVLSKRWQSETHNANLIMVTSALPAEGKTFVSLNLAISIACERDLRVLLVDADVSRPSIPETLGIEVDRGLVDVLTDDSVDLADVLIRTNIDGLTLLPSGRQHHLSTELLASHRMAAFTEDIAQRYADRIVIFDTPPVLATSEPSALAQHVGQIIFVVRAESTSGSAVRAAMEIIGDNPNIGFVLNQSRPQFGSASFGYYYYKGYYYHQY